MLLGNHGVFAWGADPEQALLRLELVEHLARIAVAAAPLGGVEPLPDSAIAPLLAARAKANIGRAADRAVETAAQLLGRGPAGPAVVACAPAPHASVADDVSRRHAARAAERSRDRRARGDRSRTAQVVDDQLGHSAPRETCWHSAPSALCARRARRPTTVLIQEKDMRVAAASVLSLALITGACFPDNARHRTIAKIVEGGVTLGGVVMLYGVNTTGADCAADVPGVSDQACKDRAALLGNIGFSLVLAGLIGFIVTVSTAPDDKVTTVTTTKPAEPPPAPAPGAPALETAPAAP